MSCHTYPTDLSDAQWAILKLRVPTPKTGVVPLSMPGALGHARGRGPERRTGCCPLSLNAGAAHRPRSARRIEARCQEHIPLSQYWPPVIVRRISSQEYSQ